MPDFFMRREGLFLLIALALALCGATFAYLTAPTRLTIAVGPPGGPDMVIAKSFAHALQQQKTGFRLAVVPVPDERKAAELMQDRKVDFAIVRPDVLLPVNGLTTAIMREEEAIILTPASTKIKDIGGLSKKRIGVVMGHEADVQFIARILRRYDLTEPNITLVPLPPDQIGAAFAANKIDAAALIDPPSSSDASAFVHGVAKVAGGKIRFLSIEEGEAMAQHSSEFTSATIAPGTWGGRPRQPDEEIKTVAVSYRMLARADLDRGVVAQVTQLLFQLRSRIAVATPLANLMKAPDSDTSTSAALPNHPGAVDYFEREQETFMDRYSDYVYLAMFFGSGIVSVLVWIRERFLRVRRARIDEVLDRLLGILAEVREARDLATLDGLVREVDALVVAAIGHARAGETGTQAMSALMLAIDSVRRAVADRRRDIIDARSGPGGEADGEMLSPHNIAPWLPRPASAA